MKALTEETGDVKACVSSLFPNSLLEEEHKGHLHYVIPTSDIPRLSGGFRVLEENKVWNCLCVFFFLLLHSPCMYKRWL